MPNLIKLGAPLLILALVQPSCTKIPQTPAAEGALPTIDVVQADSIPSDWGKLVSVTISPDFPRRVQLWFQDEKNVIRLVFYDMPQRRLAPKAVVFNRS